MAIDLKLTKKNNKIPQLKSKLEITSLVDQAVTNAIKQSLCSSPSLASNAWVNSTRKQRSSTQHILTLYKMDNVSQIWCVVERERLEGLRMQKKREDA